MFVSAKVLLVFVFANIFDTFFEIKCFACINLLIDSGLLCCFLEAISSGLSDLLSKRWGRSVKYGINRGIILCICIKYLLLHKPLTDVQ